MTRRGRYRVPPCHAPHRTCVAPEGGPFLARHCAEAEATWANRPPSRDFRLSQPNMGDTPIGSGKGEALPPPPPLETARAPFDACSSSLANAPPARRDADADHQPARLHDTHPGPPPVARGGRTSKPYGRRHLLCLPQRLTGLPRAARPEGSRPPFGWGQVPTPIRPITGRPSLPPSSSTRRPIGRPRGLLSLGGGDGLTTFRRCTRAG
jgi:hypothetical protein